MHKPILRSEIEEAQLHTKSNHQAARWLNVSYPRYKKYAQLYGIFERHLNVTGLGIDKGFAKHPTSIPLRDILAGKHPTYSRRKLKNRLIARKKLVEVCNICQFQERRITDQKVPLMLSFKDNNPKHMALDNLELLCYNCMFLTQGAPNVVYRHSLESSLAGTYIGRVELPITTADYHDQDDEYTDTLTDEEKQELLHEI